MSIEYVEFDEVNFGMGIPSSESKPGTQPLYHEAIFSHESCSQSFTKKAVLCPNLSGTESKTQRIASMKVGGGGSVDVNISWGGKDGVTVSGGASGEIHDSNGNYAKGEVRHDSNGEGSATISGGHKSYDR